MRMPVGFGMLRETLALRPYRLFVIGTLSSNVGQWVQRIAIGWLTWELTQSTAWLGGIAIAEAAPTIALGFVAGTFVDRADQVKLLRVTQSFSLVYAAALAFFTLTHLIGIWLLVSLVLARGVVIAFSRPTRMTVIFGLVGREYIPAALAMNSMIFNFSRFLGPAVGGAIIAGAGTGWSFVAAFLLFLPINLALRAIDQARITMPPAAPQAARSIWAETVEGIRYILGHDGIRMQLALLILTSICAKPLTDLFPGFAAGVFHRGSTGLAWLLSLHGAYGRTWDALPRVTRQIGMFVLAVVGWVFFRSATFEMALSVLRAMFLPTAGVLVAQPLLATFALVAAGSWAMSGPNAFEMRHEYRFPGRVVLASGFAAALAIVIGLRSSPFLYFQF